MVAVEDNKKNALLKNHGKKGQFGVVAGAAIGCRGLKQDGDTEEDMEVQDLLGKADDLLDRADGRELAKGKRTKMEKALEEARHLLKQMNKTQEPTSGKKQKTSMKKASSDC